VEVGGFEPPFQLCKSCVLPITPYPQEFSMAECETCSKEFEADPRYRRRGHARFCSISCSSSRKRPQPPNVVCAYCEKSFYMSPSKQRGSKSGLHFCSREHKDLAQRLSGLKEIQPPHYGTAKVPDYQYARTDSCQRCGYNNVPGILEVHHLDRDRSNNSPANLVCLCPNCHNEEHYAHKTGRYGRSSAK